MERGNSEEGQSEDPSSLAILVEEIQIFAAERDWEQFHTPRNLLLALVGEVGELAEQMQWCSDDELRSRMETEPGPIEEEVADVAIYLLRLSAVLEIDLTRAIKDKMEANRARYDAERFRGSPEKAPGLTGKSDDRED
jgi:dCTP diphosphatase